LSRKRFFAFAKNRCGNIAPLGVESMTVGCMRGGGKAGIRVCAAHGGKPRDFAEGKIAT
jgi:hypothetical protein